MADAFEAGQIAGAEGFQAIGLLEAGLEGIEVEEESLPLLLTAYKEALTFGNGRKVLELGSVIARIFRGDQRLLKKISARVAVKSPIQFAPKQVVLAQAAGVLGSQHEQREESVAYGMMGIGDRLKRYLPGLRRPVSSERTGPLTQIKNRLPFDLHKKINVVFIVGQLSKIPSGEVEATLLRRIQSFVEQLPTDENIIILGHENLDLFGGMLAKRYAGRWQKSSFAKAIEALGKKRPNMFWALGNLLFSANGNHQMLGKKDDPSSQEEGESVAFRLCSAVHQYSLTQNVPYYFVPASGLETEDERVLKGPFAQTIYINDGVLGLRRAGSNQDTGWVKAKDNPEAIKTLDDSKHKHFILDLGSE